MFLLKIINKSNHIWRQKKRSKIIVNKSEKNVIMPLSKISGQLFSRFIKKFWLEQICESLLKYELRSEDR